MYQDLILSHYRAPHNRRTIDGATGEGHRKNPLCGDEMLVQVRIEHDVVADVAFGGRACSIAIASASMLTDAVRGLSIDDALSLASAIDAMLQGADAALPPALEGLRGVSGFPARHGCVTMPWAALRDAVSHHSSSHRDASAG